MVKNLSTNSYNVNGNPSIVLYVRTVMRVNKKNPSNVAMGERIKLARETAGLTQEKLAEAVGVSIQYISDLERGVVGTSIPMLTRICTTLHISSDFILFGSFDTSNLSNVTHKLSSLSTEQLKILERGIDVLIVALNYETKKE